jgi:hypothetical protein
MQMKAHHLQESGITLTDSERTSDTKILTIPAEWVLEMRVASKMSLSVGDVIQETLRIVHGYESIKKWEEHASRMNLKASVVMTGDSYEDATKNSDVVYYKYSLPVVNGVDMLQCR